jgi:hypothetical protein
MWVVPGERRPVRRYILDRRGAKMSEAPTPVIPDAAVASVYAELRRLAGFYMASRQDSSINLP